MKDLPIVVIIISVLVVISLPLFLIIYTRWLRKRRLAFVRLTSQRIDALRKINNDYEHKFGCTHSCDITATNNFKYKRTFEHFCQDENKVAKFTFEYQDAILKSMRCVLKNSAVNVLYRKEIESIEPTKLVNIKMKYHLSPEKYVTLENEIFNQLRFNAPETFIFHVIAKYRSEKGYSNYRYDINCNDGWLQEKYLELKKVDLAMTAHKMIMSEFNAIPEIGTEKQSKKAAVVKSIKPTQYNRVIPTSELLEMNYEQIVSYLLGKYGAVNGDYFLTENCKSKNKKISRSKEGFFIHHIDEDKAILLSNDSHALQNPFRYQKADRLVYCDIFEHLILHVKIAEEQENVYANPELVGIGGAVNFICRQINDCYSDYEFKQPMMILIRDMIKDRFDEYITILKRLLKVIENNTLYASLIKKEQLTLDYRGNVVERVYNALR